MKTGIGSSLIQNAPAVDAIKSTSTQKPSALGNAGEFAKLLGDTQASSANKVGEAALASKLKFSNHAVERMQQRGIFFSPEQLTRIESAATKAANKGAKETLVLADDSALIVSQKNNTIVTVMDKEALKNNVFTQIDSTVFA